MYGMIEPNLAQRMWRAMVSCFFVFVVEMEQPPGTNRVWSEHPGHFAVGLVAASQLRFPTEDLGNESGQGPVLQLPRGGFQFAWSPGLVFCEATGVFGGGRSEARQPCFKKPCMNLACFAI